MKCLARPQSAIDKYPWKFKVTTSLNCVAVDRKSLQWVEDNVGG